MIGLEEIRRCDEHPDVDFSDEKEVMRFVRPMKWLSLDVAGHRVLRINVRPPPIALAPLRRRAIRSTVDPFRAPPLAALDRARLAARVSSADVRGKILVNSPNRHVISFDDSRLGRPRARRELTNSLPPSPRRQRSGSPPSWPSRSSGVS